MARRDRHFARWPSSLPWHRAVTVLLEKPWPSLATVRRGRALARRTGSRLIVGLAYAIQRMAGCRIAVARAGPGAQRPCNDCKMVGKARADDPGATACRQELIAAVRWATLGSAPSPSTRLTAMLLTQ